MKTTYKVKALKFFHSGLLKGMSVDWQVTYPTLERALEATKFLAKHSEAPVEDLQGKLVTYHCWYIEVE